MSTTTPKDETADVQIDRELIARLAWAKLWDEHAFFGRLTEDDMMICIRYGVAQALSDRAAEPTVNRAEQYTIGIDGSRSVYVQNADGSWPGLPTRVETDEAQYTAWLANGGGGDGPALPAGQYRRFQARIDAETHSRIPDRAAEPKSAANTDPAKLARIRLLAEVELHLQSTRIFITTREKMHPCGVDIHDELLAKVTAAISEEDARND